MLSLFSPPFSSPNFPPLLFPQFKFLPSPHFAPSPAQPNNSKKPPTTTTSPSTRKEKTTKPPAPTETTSTVNLPPKKKVLIPIGHGTEEMEAVIMIDVMRQAGADVLVASVEPQLEVKTSIGIRLVADTPITKC